MKSSTSISSGSKMHGVIWTAREKMKAPWAEFSGGAMCEM